MRNGVLALVGTMPLVQGVIVYAFLVTWRSKETSMIDKT